MQTINPHDDQVIRTYEAHSAGEVEKRIQAADRAFAQWSQTGFGERARLLHRLADLLRARKQIFAELMAQEMGKVLKDGEAEIEKCALCCTYYAENGAKFLADDTVKTDASRSYISYEALGVVLAVMPWNFPFWQVFRFAAPGVMAGNVALLKHAGNVCGTALAIEDLFREAGFPSGVFTTLLIPGERASELLAHPLIKAVTLTGSTAAGQAIAAAAGKHLKKSVLELGGSDAYLVLADADPIAAAKICAQSRLINGGQSCIAAKRFIVAKSLKEDFETEMRKNFEAVKWGDPRDAQNSMGPLARRDLRDDLQAQVDESLRQGARLVCGGAIPKGPGAYYPPTILADVRPGMPAFDQELFGPVAALIEASDENEAFNLANLSVFGLGSAIFSRDMDRISALAKRLQAGSVFVNALVKSDPRLPFGGIKQSGYGRELSQIGIKEFVNIKTVYIA